MTTPSPKKRTGLDKIAASLLAPPEQPDEIGRLGVYRVLSVLGKGGMGMVFRAEDPGLRRLVALKIMLPELARRGSAKDRFLREARLAATLEHDHVVTIHQVGEDRGIPFIAMSFLKGMSLDDWLKQKRPLAMPQILRIGRETAKGLAAAHERGLIHRDIKPANLWLDGATRGRVKILDFGLARAEKEDVALTRSGQIVGTPQYMSPEQAAGTQLDARSDLFSLGVVLYRMCTGTQPFRGDNVMAVLTALAVHEPPPAIALNPETPPAFSELIDRLLRKKPAERVASAKEVVEAIAKIERERAQQKLAAAPTELTVTAAPTADAARIAASQAFNFEDSTDSLLSDEDLAVPRKAKEPTASRPAWLWPALFGGIAALVFAVVAIPMALLSSRSNGVEVAKDKDRPGPIVDKKTTPAPQPVDANPADLKPAEPKRIDSRPDKKVDAAAASNAITVDLLPLVDVNQDRVSGAWKMSTEGLECESGALARILIPYRPVDQYDFRIVFSRRTAGSAIDQILTHGGTAFTWCMNVGGNSRGFEEIDGKSVQSNPKKSANSYFKVGERHESTVQVRRKLLRAYVDGKLVREYWTSYSEMSMHPDWTLGDNTLLGVGSAGGAIRFHEIDVVERSGPGEFLRPGDPAAKAAAAKRGALQPSSTSPPSAVAPFDAAKAAEYQRLWAEHLGRKVEETNSIGMRLRLIPPGEFTMGDAGFGNSKPHPVRLTRPFYLGACEVTRGEYGKFTSDPTLPQGGVSWKDADQFCRQLSERTEERAAGRRYRLPTEAEWEYACRAGTTTKFNFGDTVDLARANFKGADPAKLWHVGSYPPNAWGLHDMHGNVREWVADWYAADYPVTGPRDDPKGPSTGTKRIVRGGGMSDLSSHSGERTMTQMPGTTYSDIGFRVVCEIDGPAVPLELKSSAVLPFEHSVFRVAFSPDGKSLAVCGDGREIRIWDLTTNPPKLRRAIVEKSYRAAACEFDRTGSILYVGAQDGVIRAWNAATGELVEQFVGHTARVTGVAISETGERMVSSSDDKTVRVWNLKNPHEPSFVLPSKKMQNSPQPTSHDSSVSDCAVGADLAFSSTGDGRVNYWDLNKKSQLWSKRLHKDRIAKIAFAPDRESFATACHDGHVCIWTRSGELLHDIDIPGTKALGLAYSPESKLIAVGGNDAKVRVFDVASGQLLGVAVCPAKEVFAVAWSPDGRTIASGEVGGGGAARLWDVAGLRSSWEPLFDGKSFDGWGNLSKNPDDISVATIDGEPAIRITGEAKAELNSSYVSSKWRSRNFEAKLEFRRDPADSQSSGYMALVALSGQVGLPFRFSSRADGRLYSDRWRLELEQAESKKNRIAATGQVLPQRIEFPTALLRPIGEWNRFEIIRLDDAVAFRLNDRFLGAFAHLRPKLKDDSVADLGRTFFNLYRSAGTVYFRRIEVREIHELPADFAPP